jgi:hypothetical protein
MLNPETVLPENKEMVIAGIYPGVPEYVKHTRKGDMASPRMISMISAAAGSAKVLRAAR